MNKAKVPRAQSPVQDAIPLRAATITCTRQPYFVGEVGEQPITITGRQLEQILAWLVKLRPGILGKADEDVWSPADIAWRLAGLGEVLRGLAGANLEDRMIDVPDALELLAGVTNDLAAQLSVTLDGAGATTRATIAVPTRKEAAA